MCDSSCSFITYLPHLMSQIDVLKRMNYRGANAKNISDEQVRCHCTSRSVCTDASSFAGCRGVVTVIEALA
jgi:hypothetical protein